MKYKEIIDSESSTDNSAPMPTIKEMRASQQAGAQGKGTQTQSYGDMEAQFNIGTGTGKGEDDITINKQELDPMKD